MDIETYCLALANASLMSRQSFDFQGSAHHVGTAEIRFQFLENWTQVEEHDVVFSDSQIWRVLIVRRQRIASGPHNAFMSVALDAIHFPCQNINVLVNLGFGYARTNELPRVNFFKQWLGLSLGIEQSRGYCFFRLVHRTKDYSIRVSGRSKA